MKTIKEVVKEMKREELESIARSHYQGKMFELLQNICEKQRNPNYSVTTYHIIKETLMREDLFDPRYEEWLNDAVKGKLNIDKMVKEAFQWK